METDLMRLRRGARARHGRPGLAERRYMVKLSPAYKNDVMLLLN